MPKGVYVRKRKGESSAPEPEREEEEESGEEDDDDDKKEDSESEGKRRKRRKKRKALFTREKPARRQRAIERAQERAQRLKEAKERGPDQESEEKEEEKEEELTFPQPTKEELLAFTPLQLLLDHLIRTFYRKDPEEYFVFPVTDDVAPGYSEVVSEQMNYFTMRGKVDSGEYPNLDAFKSDVHLILKNAFAYNKPNTVYNAAAKKLEQMAALYFSRTYIIALAQARPFIRDIPVAELGFTLPTPVFAEQPLRSKRRGTSAVLDNMTANEVLVQAEAAAASARQKLATFRPNTKELEMGFLNRKEDGTTVLNILTPEAVGPVGEGESGERRQVTLGDIVPRPKEGNPGLAPWSEAAENLLAPVNFLNYGPFASFAPHVDSTWATLNKDVSAKLLTTYGGDSDAVEYAWSLRNFVSESGDYLIGMVDSLLDTLTGGEHSKLHGKAVEELAKSEGRGGEGEDVDWEGLRSLGSLGIDVSFLESLGAPRAKAETALEETARLLDQLETTQHQRLSKNPGLTLTNVRGPDQGEVELAGAVVQKLSAAVGSVRPSDVVGEREIRECLGIADDIDMDLLNEFLVPQ